MCRLDKKEERNESLMFEHELHRDKGARSKATKAGVDVGTCKFTRGVDAHGTSLTLLKLLEECASAAGARSHTKSVYVDGTTLTFSCSLLSTRKKFSAS